MLPPFIIEQIRRREEGAREAERQQPRLELPLDILPPWVPEGPAQEEVVERGVVILDLG